MPMPSTAKTMNVDIYLYFVYVYICKHMCLVYIGIVAFTFLPRLAVVSNTQRRSEQSVFTGVFPPPPPYTTSRLSLTGFPIPTAHRLSSVALRALALLAAQRAPFCVFNPPSVEHAPPRQRGLHVHLLDYCAYHPTVTLTLGLMGRVS